MIENYDILKENNLRQLVSEYENERKNVLDAHTKYEQRRHDWMKKAALDKLEKIREFEMYNGYTLSLENHYDHKGFMWEYNKHFYQNAYANLVRKYAAVYDPNNLDKYPVSTPLPKMKEVWNPYFPFKYSTLKKFAAHCPRWR